MSDKQKTMPIVPAGPAEHAECETWGKGGSYIVVDGKRVPAPPETEAVAAPAEAPVKSTAKGK